MSSTLLAAAGRHSRRRLPTLRLWKIIAIQVFRKGRAYGQMAGTLALTSQNVVVQSAGPLGGADGQCAIHLTGRCDKRGWCVGIVRK